MTDVELEELYQYALDRAHRAGARVVRKEGAPWTWIDRALKILTFGKMNRFMDSFVTTIGGTIAIPGGPPAGGRLLINEIAMLEHELVHVRQFKFCGFGNANLGIPLMFLVYVLLPMPVGFAWGRYMLERYAYLREIEVARDLGETDSHGKEDWEWRIDRAVENLKGPNYAWTWLFASPVWFRKKLGLPLNP